MQLSCPCCHARFPFDAALQDEAARELMGLLAQAEGAMRPLVSYLTFFRSKSRALQWERALKLVRDVLELTGDREVLAAALTETCASLDAKRAETSWKPLGNHNYLKAVLTSVAARAEVRGSVEVTTRTAPTSRQGHALAALESKKRGP